MMLSITDVSRKSEVPTSTLRYYDRVGLLKSAGRAENGYRQYDERALDRLQFIARAQELGCSLEEIAKLLTAFDDDCADVQGTLRALVDRKILVGQQRIAEMIALTAQLQEARHALTAEAAPGACGPGCVCLLETTTNSIQPTLMQLSASSESNAAIACSLDHAEMGGRIAEWQAALEGVTGRTMVEGGVRLSIAPDAELAELARLAQAEWTCCSFFSFAITVDNRGTALEIRAPEAAHDLVQSVFGVAT